MAPDRHRSKNFRSRSDIDVPLDHRYALSIGSDRDLLKNKAIWPNHGIGMNDDPVGVGQHHTTFEFAIHGNVGP